MLRGTSGGQGQLQGWGDKFRDKQTNKQYYTSEISTNKIRIAIK